MISRLLAATVLALVFISPLAAQQLIPPPPLHGEGSELFRGLLHYHGIKPATIDQLATDELNRETILILFGPRTIVGRNDTARISRVVLNAGGAVLIANDNPTNLTQYFINDDSTRLVVQGAVFAPVDGINGNVVCPYVVPYSPVIPFGQPSEWGIFKDLQSIGLNRSSFLTQIRPTKFTRSVLAGFPATATIDGDGRIPLPSGSAFAVGGSGDEKDPFRSLVVADPNVFSNQMFAAVDPVRGPTDNLIFANRVVEWLKDGGGVNRTRCVFIEGGREQLKFDDVKYESLSMPPVPVPPLPNPLDPKVQGAFVNSANEALARWQDKDGPNAALVRNPPDEYRFNRVLRFLLVTMAAVAALLLLVRLLFSGHSPSVPKIPTDTGRVAASGPPGSLARRKEEILQAGNYTAVVREYLQELFFAQGLPDPAPSRMPQVETSGRDRRTLLEDLDTLWDVAFGHDRTPILYSRWKELEPMIDEVRRAAENGRWRFTPRGNA